MNNFFLASGLIFICSLLIGCFYFIRNVIHNRRQKKLFETIIRKIKTDKKEYLRNYLKHHIPKLQENKIQWIIISIKPNPENSIEITYDKMTNEIQVIKRDCKLQRSQKLKEFGVNNIVELSDSFILKIVPNAKIITDVIYYLFEVGFANNNFINYKLITSTKSN